MTTRKPKLNLLYVADSSTPWLQLAVVTTEPNSSQHHARHWQAARGYEPARHEAVVAAAPRKH
jgi:hypothetical protein